MQTSCARQARRPRIAFTFHFALGKAFEDAGQFAESFKHYEKATACDARRRLRRGLELRADAALRRRCSRRNSSQRARGQGREAPHPIFIVGLPRSGSTLLEQILSSHPQVEGTMELADIPTWSGSWAARSSRQAASIRNRSRRCDAEHAAARRALPAS
jgi:hypothetical protein